MKVCLTPLALALLLWGQAAAAANLAQIYRDAQDNDPQFASAKATLEAHREAEAQGLSALLPNVSLGARAGHNNVDMSIHDPSASKDYGYNNHGYTLSLTQPLFRWQSKVQYDQAKLQVAQAEAQFLQAKQDLILRTAQAYFDVLYAQENLRAVLAQKAAIGQQLALAKKSFEVGTVTITDTHEAQARYDLAQAQEIAARNDLEIRERTLQAIIGKEGGDLASLRNGVALSPPKPALMNDWVTAAESGNIGVQVQQIGSDIASREVEKQRAGHYPTVDLVASRNLNSQGRTYTGAGIAGYTIMPIPALDQTTTTLGVQVNIPLYQGGYVVSKQREAAANYQAALSGLENARRQAALGARQYFLGVTNGLAQVKALEAANVSSKSALDSNKLGYEVGVRINIDVLNAEQQVYTTRRDLAKARFDTLMAQLRLKAAVGTLGDEDVQQVNALLESR